MQRLATTDQITDVLDRIPERQRKRVQEFTLDMAAAMKSAVRIPVLGEATEIKRIVLHNLLQKMEKEE